MIRNSVRLFMFLLLAVSGAVQARACALSTVSIDTENRTIRWDLTFPKGVNALRLSPGNKSDQINWTVDPAIASLQHGTLVRASAKTSMVTLTSTLPQYSRHQDRVYSPTIVFEDGSVAVLSSLFNFSMGDGAPRCTTFIAPSKGKVGTGDKWNRLSVVNDALVSGYIVFGNPKIEQTGGLTLVLDKGVPSWAKEEIVHTLESAIGLYAAKMEPQPLPPIIIYTQNTPGVAYHWGDRLPGSITLGLFGKNWRVRGQSLEDDLKRFIAHEIFHVWNGRVNFVDDGNSLLAVEGGAELASVFARAKTSTQPNLFVLNNVSDALNQCQLDLAYGNSLNQLLQAPHPGVVPYHCGMILMFAATAAPNIAAAAGDNFFNSWKSVLAGGHEKAHRWSDLVVENQDNQDNQDNQKVENLNQAIFVKGKFVDYIKIVLAMDGYEVLPDGDLSPTIKNQLATVIMADLMQIDCAGAVSFWSQDGGFLIDPQIESCRTLHPGATVTSILGKKPWDDPMALVAKLHSLCQERSAVSVGYDHGIESSFIACRKEFPDTPVPVRIVRK